MKRAAFENVYCLLSTFLWSENFTPCETPVIYNTGKLSVWVTHRQKLVLLSLRIRNVVAVKIYMPTWLEPECRLFSQRVTKVLSYRTCKISTMFIYLFICVIDCIGWFPEKAGLWEDLISAVFTKRPDPMAAATAPVENYPRVLCIVVILHVAVCQMYGT